MKRFTPTEMIQFLEAVDRLVETPVALVIIGGSALALGYGVSAATTDIDTFGADVEDVQRAAALAREQTGLAVAVGPSVVAQLPDGYRERLNRVIPHLTKLHLWVLDRYDLAASKLLRGVDKDRQQLRQLHELVPFDRDTLVQRFQDLLGDYVGDPTEPRWSLYFFVEELWGELDALALRP